MKDNAVLVNLSRGQIIDEKALVQALRDGKFYGVALDVFEKEPLLADNPLWSFERVIITPHNSFVGSGNIDRVFSRIVSNLSDYHQQINNHEE